MPASTKIPALCGRDHVARRSKIKGIHPGDVFDRDHTFDPRMDSIVRVEALRARKKLASYYAGEGRQDEVLISLTKGNYRARFALAPKPGRVLNGTRLESFGRGSIRFWESTGPAGTTDWVERGAGDYQTFPNNRPTAP